ncbi:hypothetical protein [Streptomyces sp. HUAS 31]|uniref:hypothetical protein n=1 Tax=Streptomyces sp. HUAS 31 TaxID=3020055 RepID=UPI003FA7B3B7
MYGHAPGLVSRCQPYGRVVLRATRTRGRDLAGHERRSLGLTVNSIGRSMSSLHRRDIGCPTFAGSLHDELAEVTVPEMWGGGQRPDASGDVGRRPQSCGVALLIELCRPGPC